MPTMVRFPLKVAFGRIAVRVRLRVILEMFVKVLVFLMLAVVTIGRGFAMRGL
jgi:hypothetical protein